MYHHSRNDDFGSTVVLLGVIALLLLAWVVVRLLAFVVRTFVQHYKNMALWIALAFCIVCCGVGVLLSVRVSQGFMVLPVLGVSCLLVVTLIVHLRGRTTLLPESVNLVHQVLHSPWWSDNDTPLQPGSTTNLLAA